jgi:hypothetical protein
VGVGLGNRKRKQSQPPIFGRPESSHCRANSKLSLGNTVFETCNRMAKPKCHWDGICESGSKCEETDTRSARKITLLLTNVVRCFVRMQVQGKFQQDGAYFSALTWFGLFPGFEKGVKRLI